MGDDAKQDWPLYEIFIRAKSGLDHKHVGSLHATDARMALEHARDLYTRRQEGVSIWAVRSADIVASDPSDADAFFEPAKDKVYRHPTLRHPGRGEDACDAARTLCPPARGYESRARAAPRRMGRHAPRSRKTSGSRMCRSTCSGRRACCSRMQAASRPRPRRGRLHTCARNPNT